MEREQEKTQRAKVGQNVKKDKKGFAIFSNMFDGAVARLSCVRANDSFLFVKFRLSLFFSDYSINNSNPAPCHLHQSEHPVSVPVPVPVPMTKSRHRLHRGKSRTWRSRASGTRCGARRRVRTILCKSECVGNLRGCYRSKL